MSESLHAKEPDHDPDLIPREESAWEAARAQGIDMSLIELNLEMTPWERLLKHEQAIQFAEELRNARRITDA